MIRRPEHHPGNPVIGGSPLCENDELVVAFDGLLAVGRLCGLPIDRHEFSSARCLILFQSEFSSDRGLSRCLASGPSLQKRRNSAIVMRASSHAYRNALPIPTPKVSTTVQTRTNGNASTMSARKM